MKGLRRVRRCAHRCSLACLPFPSWPSVEQRSAKERHDENVLFSKFWRFLGMEKASGSRASNRNAFTPPSAQTLVSRASFARGVVFGRKIFGSTRFAVEAAFRSTRSLAQWNFKTIWRARCHAGNTGGFGLLATRNYEFYELQRQRICWSFQLKALAVYGFRCARKNHRHSPSSGTQLTS